MNQHEPPAPPDTCPRDCEHLAWRGTLLKRCRKHQRDLESVVVEGCWRSRRLAACQPAQRGLF